MGVFVCFRRRKIYDKLKKPPKRKALVYPAGVEPTSAEPESAILSIELWVQCIGKDKALNVEAEVHDIPVLYDVALTFHA